MKENIIWEQKNPNPSDLSECGERQMEEKQEIGHMCVLALLSLG